MLGHPRRLCRRDVLRQDHMLHFWPSASTIHTFLGLVNTHGTPSVPFDTLPPLKTAKMVRGGIFLLLDCSVPVKTKLPARPVAGATKESAKSKALMPCLMTTPLGGDMPPAPLLLCPPGVCGFGFSPSSSLFCVSSSSFFLFFSSSSVLFSWVSSSFLVLACFCCLVVVSVFSFSLSVFHCCLFIIVPSPLPRPCCSSLPPPFSSPPPCSAGNKGLTRWPLVRSSYRGHPGTSWRRAPLWPQNCTRSRN